MTHLAQSSSNFVLLFRCRHLFYLQVKQLFQEDQFRIPDDHQMALISALIAQAEHGDCACAMTSQTAHAQTQQLVCACQHSPCVPHGAAEHSPPELYRDITQLHSQNAGLSRASAEYKMLQEVSTEDFQFQFP